MLQDDLNAVSDERDEDVGFDAVFALVIDRPHRQIAFQLFEGGFDFAQLQVELPELGGIGQVLLDSQIENRREILWCSREQIADLPEAIRCLTGADFISRTYRIIAGGQPVMLINEKFPTNAMPVVNGDPSFQPSQGDIL